MTSLIKLSRSNAINPFFRHRSTAASAKDGEDQEFRVLQLWKKKEKVERRIVKRAVPAPDRAERMSPDQKWSNVWPGPRSFHPSAVPLPLRQGYVPPGKAPPGKKANAELMKIPNFLHLTPPAIKEQCEALKQFCTEWPRGLYSEEAIEKHYPIEEITSDYVHASPTIRNPLVRIVSLRFKLKSLNLDQHARDKMLRLIGDRYDPDTDLVTITADRCPLRKQNSDYANYLLTALYHESSNVEGWEAEKTEADMEVYIFDNNQSRKSLIDWYLRCHGNTIQLTDEEYKNFDVSLIDHGSEFKEAVTELINDGETEESLKKYGDAVRALLGMPQYTE